MIEFTSEELHKLFQYNNGQLYWKTRDRNYFESDRDHRWWNSRYSGTRAGANRKDSSSSLNYRWVKIFKKSYPEQNIIWFMCHGYYPINILDHIDHDPSNNRIENLREVTPSENSKNRKLSKNNKSGVHGVAWVEKYATWRVTIRVDNKTISLGCYKSLFDAVCIRKSAEISYGFHHNHGKPYNE